MKFLVKTLLVFFICFNSWAGDCRDGIECSDVYSSLVFDFKDGKIISEVRSQKSVFPASLVKLMTAYLTFEAIENGKLSFNDRLTVSKYGEEISAVNKVTTLKLLEGDYITVRQAVRGMIIKSFNEAAVTLAEAIAGNEWDFARLMNKKAIELGMYHTNFRNSTGLHDDGQYTTAYDLARLSKALKEDFPQYYHFFSETSFKFNNKHFVTHNHVLRDYPGAEGLKTGFTRASGFNLISIAKRDNNSLASVLANCASYQSRDEHTKDVFDQTFAIIEEVNQSKIRPIIKRGIDFSKSNPKTKYINHDKYSFRVGGGW